MINYLLSGIKYIKLKMFSRNIKCYGIPVIDYHSIIESKDGYIELGHKMSTRSNVRIHANEGGKISIGSLVFFNYNCIVVCKGNVKIGDGTVFGPNVSIFDHNHKYSINGVSSEMSVGSVIIGEKCWIGAGSTILKGFVIGDGCIIGAGTIFFK